MSATIKTTATTATEPNNEPNNEPTILNKLFQERDGIFAKVTDAFKDAFKTATITTETIAKTTAKTATEPNNEPTMLINKLFQERDGIFAKTIDAFKDAFKIAVENNGNCGNCRDFGDRGNYRNFVFTIPACSM